MKILGQIIMHYGSPYLGAVLESIMPQVDHMVILYTDYPSQGFMPDHPCPDTQENLIRIADPWWDRITWVHGHWPHEGAHVDAIWDFAPGYHWVVRVDSDEIFPAGMVAAMIAQAEKTDHRHYRLPIQHFWRSFSRVCRDGQMPVRLTRVMGLGGEQYLDAEGGKWAIAHMGYAQPTKYIQYKLQVSGHRPEFRLDWFEDRWLANAQEDLHPVCYDFWKTEDYDKTKLPKALLHHPFYNLEIIE